MQPELNSTQLLSWEGPAAIHSKMGASHPGLGTIRARSLNQQVARTLSIQAPYLASLSSQPWLRVVPLG